MVFIKKVEVREFYRPVPYPVSFFTNDYVHYMVEYLYHRGTQTGGKIETMQIFKRKSGYTTKPEVK